MSKPNFLQLKPHFRYFAWVTVLCFAIEFGIMVVIHNVTTISHIGLAAIDATIVSITLLGSLYFWIFPRLAEDKNKAQDQTRLLESLMDAIPAPIFYKNEDGVYTGCNEQFEKYLGLSRDQIVGKTVYDVAPSKLAEIYHQADLDLIRQGGSQVYETSVSHGDGTIHDVMFHKAVFRKSNDQPGGIIGVMLDITERKRLEDKLLALASLDDLTNIANRRELDTNLEHALARTARTRTQLALLFIDMDGFKDVNDKCGHEAGDEALKQIAARIVTLLRKSDIAGRMGGDEFAVILEGKVSRDTTILVAQKLLETLAAPYDLSCGQITNLSASIGIAFAPDDGSDLKHLLSKADAAMYEAKRLGKNRYVLATDFISAQSDTDQS
ncbi:diguanylate cyclase domain-containing protein [Magnetovibrio sp.]|uniref:diguanylate cyclase domain-containing protein n=1 Tax=Magnetovibrio sp. TaxID=2024836 RepID=UPI002F94E76B